MRTRVLIAVGILVAGLAFAQTTGDEGPMINLLDPSTWFASTAALAAFIATVIAFARKHVLRTLDGSAVVVISVGLGAALGLLGHALGTLDGGLLPSIVFGVTAGLSASGGIDLLRGVLGTKSGGGSGDGTPPVTGTLPG